MDEKWKIENEFDKLEKSLVKRKWKCMCPNCNENAINSHLLQRNGILNNVACLRRSKFSQLHRTKSVTHEFANLISRQS